MFLKAARNELKFVPDEYVLSIAFVTITNPDSRSISLYLPVNYGDILRPDGNMEIELCPKE